MVRKPGADGARVSLPCRPPRAGRRSVGSAVHPAASQVNISLSFVRRDKPAWRCEWKSHMLKSTDTGTGRRICDLMADGA